MFLTLGRIIILRTSTSKESKKLLLSKYMDSEAIRKNLGCHLVQSSNITDEIRRAQTREVKFPKET